MISYKILKAYIILTIYRTVVLSKSIGSHMEIEQYNTMLTMDVTCLVKVQILRHEDILGRSFFQITLGRGRIYSFAKDNFVFIVFNKTSIQMEIINKTSKTEQIFMLARVFSFLFNKKIKS